ncbi:MAG: hypothetical protein GKR94_17125 [Gammaproteobacteria bacterium]|nr:hypothetical protein [Gammaproteobacteria bacterium]NKC13840.1 hypothetical protein [Gammaproteobacteria bacterium]
MNPPSNWHKYLNLLAKKQVPEGARRGYVRHVERLLKAFPGKSLSALSKADVEVFLGDLSRQHRLHDWQFRQAVDALRLLLVDLTNTPAGQAVDWWFWREAPQSLEPNHATLREQNSWPI